VSDEDLQTILTASMKTANASARQSYSIVVLEDRNTMAKLGYQGSKALIYCVDYNRIADAAAYLNRPFHSREIVSSSPALWIPCWRPDGCHRRQSS
jgi:nitroreductase